MGALLQNCYWGIGNFKLRTNHFAYLLIPDFVKVENTRLHTDGADEMVEEDLGLEESTAGRRMAGFGSN